MTNESLDLAPSGDLSDQEVIHNYIERLNAAIKKYSLHTEWLNKATELLNELSSTTSLEGFSDETDPTVKTDRLILEASAKWGEQN